MRLIGVELRVEYLHPQRGNIQEEICLLPCNVILEIPDLEKFTWSQDARINATLHTDRGDFNLTPAHNIPTVFLFPDKTRAVVK